MKKKHWVSIIILNWVLLVISAYYVFHKPITAAQLAAWIKAGGQILSSGAVIVLAGGIGRKLFPLSNLQPREALSLQASLGLGLLGTGLMSWGAAIGYQRWVLLGLFIGLLVLFSRSSLAWARQFSKLQDIFQQGKAADLLIKIIILVILGAGLLRALAPPLKFDSLVYHLSLPARYLHQESFTYLADNVYWGMPQVQEMLFLFSMAPAGVEAGPVLGWWIGVFSLISVYLLVQRCSGDTPAWVAVLTLISGLTTARSLSWGYTLWLNVLWGSSFLLILWHREQVLTGEQENEGEFFSRELGLLFMAGLTAGFAMGTKYTSGLLVPIGLGVLLWGGIRRTFHDFWKRAGGFLLGAGAAFSPWLIKNLAAVGNPLYPFFLPSGAMESWRLSVLSNPEGAMSFWQTLMLPVASTVLGIEGGPGYAASIGPLFLALGAVGLLAGGKDPQAGRLLRIVKFSVLAGLMIWAGAGMISVHLSQTRLYAVLFPAAAVLVGAGYESLGRYNFRRVRLRVLVLGLILMVAVFNVIQVGTEDARDGSLRHFLGVMDDQEYLTNNLGWYKAAVASPEELPEGARLVMLWEPRGYYCLPSCDSDEILDRWHFDLRKQGGRVDVVRTWIEDGYTHLLYHRAGADFVRSTDERFSAHSWKELDRALESLPLIEDYGGVYQLYLLEVP